MSGLLLFAMLKARYLISRCRLGWTLRRQSDHRELVLLAINTHILNLNIKLTQEDNRMYSSLAIFIGKKVTLSRLYQLIITP
jgi:hypothetical protein